MDFGHCSLSGGGALTIEHTGHTYPRSRGSTVKEGKGPSQQSISGEWQLAKRHWEHVNAAYHKKDNSGLAVWCMFDYNTFHNTTEQGMVHHGVCDLQRLPKESYFWYMSELTEAPMAHIIRASSSHVTVVSNCDEIELHQDTGNGFTLLKRQKPDAGYKVRSKSGEREEPYALKHPPYTFEVSAEAKAIKAVGYRNGTKVTEDLWREPRKAVALALETDRKSIAADGSDFSRIIVSAVDENGTVVPDFAEQVSLDLKGPGRLIGDHPFKLRYGKFVVLAAAFYETGTITVEAKASGVTPATVSLRVDAVTGHVYFPEVMPATEALKRNFSQNAAGTSAPGDAAAGKTVANDPAPFEMAPVLGAAPDAWVISEDIMISGRKEHYAVEIKGGEYQIYAQPYTAKAGTIVPGDAIRVRVRAARKSGETVTATLSIGNVTRTFKVTTK